MKCLNPTFAALIIVLYFSVTGLGQGLFGSVEGTVTDYMGAIIPGAMVSIESTGTTGAYRQTVTANRKGYFAFPRILPGTYEVVASGTGFNASKRTATGTATNSICTP